MKDWVRTTAQISTSLQFIFGLISLFGFININRKPEFLANLLICDVVVQFIEFLFYITFIRLKLMVTYYRYFDWFLTTPTMLVTTAGFMEYLNDNTMTTQKFTSNYSDEIIYLILMNSMMLSFGFVGEVGYANIKMTALLGFVPFIATFVVIFVKFARSNNSFIVISIVTFIWSLYGYFALLDYTKKNIGYNVLDIFSKNIFGLFLSIYLLNM